MPTHESIFRGLVFLVIVAALIYSTVRFVHPFSHGNTSSAFSLLPPKNATGNFVKVVQRVPVKIVMESKPDRNNPLWFGLFVIPTVDTSRKTGPKLSSYPAPSARR